jgi:O-antigen/teichoic acid export membrane protein
MIRNIATLLSGNALSQLVNVATIVFVVTVFFSPEEFGRYAVVMAYVGILSSVACLRFELGIVSVGRDLAANNLAAFCFSTVVVFSLLAYAVLHLLAGIWGPGVLVGASPLAIAGLIFLKASGQVVTSVLYRRERYPSVSMLKLLQALVLLAGFWSAGRARSGLGGLVAATLASYAAFALAGAASVRITNLGRGVRPARVAAIAKRNADFLRFSTPQTLVDNLLSNGLNFVLVGFAGPTVVGYYNFVLRTLKAPLALIFGAVTQVLFRFSARFARDPAMVVHKLRQTSTIVNILLALIFVGVVVVYFAFDRLPYLTGWAGMREYLPAFAVWMLAPFIFSPFATLPVVYGGQKQFFQVATAYNLISLLILAALLWAGFVTVAFWVVGLAAIPYFLAMNHWIFRLAGSIDGG